jgi:hypothetical protein
MSTPKRCKCERCKRIRKRVYYLVWNWEHNRAALCDALTTLCCEMTGVKQGSGACRDDPDFNAEVRRRTCSGCGSPMSNCSCG